MFPERGGRAALGAQLLADFEGCDPAKLADVRAVRSAMIEAARAAKAKVLDALFHPFAPQGVSGVVVISESHLAIHTWPELGLACVDVFTCGDKVRPRRALARLKARFGARRVRVAEVARGAASSERAEKIDNDFVTLRG